MITGSLIPKLVGGTILLVLLITPQVLVRAQQQNTMATVEIISKHYSSGYFPIVEEYVEYQLKLTNEGSTPISNQSLWALFTSKGNITNSFGSYFITSLSPYQSKSFFIGPFKMREEGQHSLFIGIDRKGNSSLSNMLPLSYRLSNKPLDSFIVYNRSFVQYTILVAAILVLIGTSIIIGFMLRRKGLRRRVSSI